MQHHFRPPGLIVLTCVHAEFSTDRWVRSESMKRDRSAALWNVEILQTDKLGWHNFISLSAIYQSWENIKYLLCVIHYALNTFPALVRHLNREFLSIILDVQVNQILAQFYHLTWSFSFSSPSNIDEYSILSLKTEARNEYAIEIPFSPFLSSNFSPKAVELISDLHHKFIPYFAFISVGCTQPCFCCRLFEQYSI